MPDLSPVSQAGIDFYENEPAAYLAAQVGRQQVAAAVRLADQLVANSRVVDAGCGTGVEARYFSSCGHHVYAFDASARMVAEAVAASEGSRIEFRRHSHHELALEEPADAIYAGASLLFLEQEDLAIALRVFAKNLVPGGILSVSFKAGDGPRRDSNGRLFHDYQPGDGPWFAKVSGLEIRDARVDQDKLGRGMGWTCLELVKAVHEG